MLGDPDSVSPYALSPGLDVSNRASHKLPCQVPGSGAPVVSSTALSLWPADARSKGGDGVFGRGRCIRIYPDRIRPSSSVPSAAAVPGSSAPVPPSRFPWPRTVSSRRAPFETGTTAHREGALLARRRTGPCIAARSRVMRRSRISGANAARSALRRAPWSRSPRTRSPSGSPTPSGDGGRGGAARPARPSLQRRFSGAPPRCRRRPAGSRCPRRRCRRAGTAAAPRRPWRRRAPSQSGWWRQAPSARPRCRFRALPAARKRRGRGARRSRRSAWSVSWASRPFLSFGDRWAACAADPHPAPGGRAKVGRRARCCPGVSAGGSVPGLGAAARAASDAPDAVGRRAGLLPDGRGILWGLGGPLRVAGRRAVPGATLRHDVGHRLRDGTPRAAGAGGDGEGAIDTSLTRAEAIGARRTRPATPVGLDAGRGGRDNNGAMPRAHPAGRAEGPCRRAERPRPRDRSRPADERPEEEPLP